MGVEDGYRRIGPDPFGVPPDRRDVTRGLRGRLASPVTIWTAYDADGAPTGITVSSMWVVEGDPPAVAGLIGPLSDFWDAAAHSGRFVVHVLQADQVRMADQFALRYPGDPFEGLSVASTGWGPALTDVGTRAHCTFSDQMAAGHFLLLRGGLDSAELGEDTAPLVHYRGRYVTTGPRRA